MFTGAELSIVWLTAIQSRSEEGLCKMAGTSMSLCSSCSTNQTTCNTVVVSKSWIRSYFPGLEGKGN